MIDLSRFTEKEELFDHIHRNKSMLMAQMKSTIKNADPVSCFGFFSKDDKTESMKSALSESDLLSMDSIRVKSVINTTNILDSHGDVHIDKIWNKTLKEQTIFYLVKEHMFDFDNVLSDEVKAYTASMDWKRLGYNWEGKTQALIFDSIIHKNDNPLMFEKYIRGKVRNHSVSMKYVKAYLAINSDNSDYKEEKEVWDKYIIDVVNKEEAESKGYFWAVTEAKIIEGSAVTKGSNYVTPTQSVTEVKREPSEDTPFNDNEPPKALTMFEQIGNKL